MLKMCVSRAFFALISKSKGSKTSNTGEKCPVLRLRPVNSHIKLQFLFTRRSGRTLRTRFPPPGSAIFRPGVEKKSLWKIRENTHLEKAWKKAFPSETWDSLKGFFAMTSPSRGLKNRWQYRKNLVPWRLSLFWNQVDPILGSFHFGTKARYRVSTKACNQTTVEFILACILSSIWIHIALIANLNLIVLADVELTLSLS